MLEPRNGVVTMTDSPVVSHVRLCVDANDVDDPEVWIERSLALGARKLWLGEEPDDWFQVMADPEGNEFCFCLVDETVTFPQR
jgi:hypothetical protein